MTDLMGLVADVGGTNVRIAGVDAAGALSDVMVSPCAEHATLGAALSAYLSARGGAVPGRAAVCVAGPVADGIAHMTNHVWTVAEADLAAATGIGRISVVNDFAALAMAVPHLSADDVRPLWPGGAAEASAPRLVIGPGTGLGVSLWVPTGDGGGKALATEGGHLALAPRTADEDAVLSALRARVDHVSFERVVSGPGLETLFEITSGGQHLGAADVVRQARDGDPAAVQATDHFFAFLGSVTADLVLATGARGGVYFGGGILPKMDDLIHGSPLQARLADKGRFSDYVSAVPVRLITHPVPALLGLAAGFSEG